MTTNSYVPFLSSMYRAILSDVSNSIPALTEDCERDLKRLLSLLKTRGHYFAMVDLPAFGKHFDRCLANGLLLRSTIPGFRPFRRRGAIPCLFKGLLQRVFEDNGMLRSDYDVLAIRFVRQLCRVHKRFRIACPLNKIKEHVNEFITVDEGLPVPSLNWGDTDFDVSRASCLHVGDKFGPETTFGENRIPPPHAARNISSTLQRVFDIVSASLGLYRPSEWDFKHGPGAVSDGPDAGDYKFNLPNWGRRLDRVYPMADFAFANYLHWCESIVERANSDVNPTSKIIAVPKTLDAPRLIASEPTSHQWCQQNLRSFFYDRVSCSWLGRSITFRSQTPNQELARMSSIVSSHATVDLSSASDRISCWLVERAFRGNTSVLDALQACRTDHVRTEFGPEFPKVVKLRKFSTMGSAITFPIQSVIFLGMCLAAICFRRGITPTKRSLSNLAKEVRVYGDDIIIPIDSWHCLVGILHLYDLKVNPAKTFGTGKFRESCGLEAFNGADVSACYVLGVPTYQRPESIISCVDSIRNFAKAGYVETAKLLIRTLPKRYKFASIDLDSGAFGLPDFLHKDTSIKTRWNPRRHVREQRIHLQTVKSGRRYAEGGPALLQYFTEACKAKFVQGERIGPALRSKTSLSLRWVEVR